MTPSWPSARESLPVSGVYRATPEDFFVEEVLGFEPGGEGEHVFLHLEKRGVNTLELQQSIARVAQVPARDVGLSGLKDRNAVTRQWFSVGLAGRQEPDWRVLEAAGDVTVLASTRHQRKLKRGVHRANRFRLRLRQLRGDVAALEARLRVLQADGVPNYFGEQRFGRDGGTLEQARRWMRNGGKLTRQKRGLLLSAQRGFVFNQLLAARVQDGSWAQVRDGDLCFLAGSRSQFQVEGDRAEVQARVAAGDVHPALPLWGAGELRTSLSDAEQAVLNEEAPMCRFLEQQGLALSYRASRLMADDFCWQFCDDDTLQLAFTLAAGGYATAVLGELLQGTQGDKKRGNGSE